MVILQTTIQDTIGLTEKVANGNLEDPITLGEAIASTPSYPFPPEALSLIENLTITAYTLTGPKIRPRFHFYLQGSEVPVKSFNISRTISNGITASVITWEGEVLEEEVGSPVEITFENPFDGTTITLLKGTLVAVEIAPPSKEIKLEIQGPEYGLKNDVFVDTSNGITGVFEYSQTRADVIARDILEGTDYTLIECPSDVISVKFNYDSRWKALKLIADITNSELWVDDNKGVHIGKKSGVATLTKILTKQVKTDVDGLINKIIIIGGEAPDGTVAVGVAQDSQSINNYGVKAKVEKVPQIQDNSTALLLAKAYLDRYNRLNRELSIELAMDVTTVNIREGMLITVDGTDYIISRVQIKPNKIKISAHPSMIEPTLWDYLQEKLNSQVQNTAMESTFYSSNSVAVSIYEEIILDPYYTGGGTGKTITVEGLDYVVLGVLHFYIPGEFKAESGTFYIRAFSNETPSFEIIINGTVLTPTDDGEASDGDKLWKVDIPGDLINVGWNDVYIVQWSGGLWLKS